MRSANSLVDAAQSMPAARLCQNRAVPGRIDIVIPAHNAAATLARALQSAVRDRPDEHVIVFCDACDDDSEAIARAFEGVTVAAGRAGSAAAARNRGAGLGDAAYVAFLDADDEYGPGWLDAVRDSIAAHPEAVAHYCAPVVDDGRGHRHRLAGGASGDIRAALLTTIKIPTPALVVRRAAFDAEQGFDESLYAAEDFDLCVRLHRHGPFRFVPGDHVVMHQHWPSLTRGDLDGLLRYRDATLRALDKLAPLDEVVARARDQAETDFLVDSAVRLLAAGHPRAARQDLHRALARDPGRWRAWALAGLTVLRPDQVTALRTWRARWRRRDRPGHPSPEV